jgi:hypothetical protein
MTDLLQTENTANGNTDTKNRAPGKGDMGAGGIARIIVGDC